MASRRGKRARSVILQQNSIEDLLLHTSESEDLSDLGDSNTSVEEDSVSSGSSDETSLEWVKEGSSRRPFDFTAKAGVQFDFGENKNPIDVFEAFLTNELAEEIARQTNLYAAQCISERTEQSSLKHRSRDRDWEETNAGEIMLLIGLLILGGIVQKPTTEMYFSKKKIISTPFFRDTMTEKRFHLLLKFLHFNDNSTFCQTTDLNPKMFKIRPVFEYLVKRFRDIYLPERCIAIDESLLLWKGRLGWKVYNPRKRARFGIESYQLCESSTGYVWNILVYTGKTTIFPSSVSGLDISKLDKPSQIVFTVVADLLNKGYMLHMDNYYSSPTLFDQLCERKTDAVGTVRVNRRNLPKDFESQELEKGEFCVWYRKKLMAMKWRDKKAVHFLSTVHDKDTKEVMQKTGVSKMKPLVAVEYSKEMGGVDLADQCVITYSMSRKRLKKYYIKMFRHLVDIAVFNAFIVHKNVVATAESQLNFRLNLVTAITEKYGQSTAQVKRIGLPTTIPDAPRLTERHFLSVNQATGTRKHSSRRCVVCLSHKKRKETIHCCEECHVPLCAVPCFKVFHTVANY